MSPPKLFEDKYPIHRRKKELLVLIVISFISLSTLFYFTYIKYSQLNLSKYPQINIICKDEIKTGDYINCTFELNIDDEFDKVFPIKARIKIRGSGHGWNAKSPKKEYRIELSIQKSFLGMRKDDDWQLFAMYYDLPRTRIKLSIELWRSLESTNPTAILPKSEYVCLFINGQYQGLYLLAERTDRKLFGLDNAQNNIDSSLIFQASFPWVQDWPNENNDIYIMDDILTDLFSFIINSSDEEFFNTETGIYSKFDKQNLIDFLLFNYFINHRDFWEYNYYLIRNTNPSKFYLCPWDFDSSFGQMGGSFRIPNENPESEIRRNLIYNRLIDNEDFMLDCKNRWIYLREDLWTEDFILNMLVEFYEEIEYLYEIEKNMWDPEVVKSKWHNKFDDSISHLYQYIPARLEFCDIYFIES